jgi:predicted RNA-binding Zn-ribbon protein involved in translation (DUF1610 family)
MTSNEYLDQQMLTIVCDSCRRKMEKSYRWVKSNSEYACTCGETTNLRSDRYRKMLANLEAEAAKQDKGA